ncbi:hypothetical protein HY631_00070 [Candidatus Uhrbacteria bacterium]|nr:hypothetical protein [Candidatus Uhrbacteria bacterium]
MASYRISISQLKESIERRAYAYGVSPAVSTLLGEYVIELIKDTYVRHTENQLVPVPAGQN